MRVGRMSNTQKKRRTLALIILYNCPTQYELIDFAKVMDPSIVDYITTHRNVCDILAADYMMNPDWNLEKIRRLAGQLWYQPLSLALYDYAQNIEEIFEIARRMEADRERLTELLDECGFLEETEERYIS